MTIQVTDPEVPRDLPPARLYLDDIEQIVNVLSTAERKAIQNRPEMPDPPSPTFQVGNKRTDQIEDLPKITKRTSDLAIRLETKVIELLFDVDSTGTHWWSTGLKRSDAWETHHKLEAIIRPRAVLLGTFAITRLPALYTVLGAAATLSAFLAWTAAYVLAHKLVPHSVAWWQALIIGLLEGAAPVVAFKLRYVILGPKSTVTLRYSYDQAARREERNSRLLFAVLGFVLGVAGTLLTQ